MKLLSHKERMSGFGLGQGRAVSHSESGSSLVITLVLGVVMIIVLMSYLQLLEGRAITRTRSLSWNSAIPILEAGIEEACTHLNRDGSALASNGWTNSVVNTHNLYSKRCDFSDGSYCLVTISNVDTLPPTTAVVYSQGFVPAPYKEGYISRMVQVTLTNTPAFSKAISAKGLIDLNGQAVVDSFDSSDTNYSSGGAYDSSKRKGGATVVTNSKSKPAVDAGNGHIYGKAVSGPGGTASTTAGGTIGDVPWSATHTGVQPDYFTDDMNATYPDQAAPSGASSWSPLTSGNYHYTDPSSHGVAVYDYMIGNGSYSVSGEFRMGSHDNMIVTGNASLYISGDFTTLAGSYIYIAPGASLTVYVAGANTKLAGGGIINGTGKASNFTYVGLPTNTSLQYAGNADFVGTVNAPQADMKITGGANMTGAAIVNTYTSKSSNVGFHYDESIMSVGPLKICDYREL